MNGKKQIIYSCRNKYKTKKFKNMDPQKEHPMTDVHITDPKVKPNFNHNPPCSLVIQKKIKKCNKNQKKMFTNNRAHFGKSVSFVGS